MPVHKCYRMGKPVAVLAKVQQCTGGSKQTQRPVCCLPARVHLWWINTANRKKENDGAKIKHSLACSEQGERLFVWRGETCSVRKSIAGERLRANPLFTTDETKLQSSNYLHNLRVRAGSGTLWFTDEVRLRVCAAEALVPPPQAPVAVGCSKTHTVTLFACEVSGRGRREDDELAPLRTSATAALLQTSYIVEVCKKRRQVLKIPSPRRGDAVACRGRCDPYRRWAGWHWAAVGGGAPAGCRRAWLPDAEPSRLFPAAS